MTSLWTLLLVQPILNLLMLFYRVMFSNLGLAILGLTVFIRIIMIPLTAPSLKMARQQQLLQPELDKLKEKFKDDKEKLAQEQLKFMKQHGFNPLAGCLPQIVQLVFLWALYQVFIQVLGAGGDGLAKLNQLLYLDFLKIPAESLINTRFLYLDLSRADPFFVLPVLAGLSQWAVSYLSTRKSGPVTPAPVEKDGASDIMKGLQGQMGILFPIMTVFISLKLQSGLVLYWFVSVLALFVQQWWYMRANATKS